MAITKEQVLYMAQLARLELTDEEVGVMALQLDQILQHAQKVSELDLRDIAPTSHAVKLSNVFRDDEVLDSLSQEQALSNAPEREQGMFKVPKII